MAITPDDKKISQFPEVTPSEGMFIPLIDLGQSDPSLRNVRASMGSILALVDLSGYVPTSRAINTSGSLTGGGDLSANRTLSLSGDSASPGNYQYYGTDGAGTKGFFALPSAGTGTVTSFSSGNLSPLFTTGVATATTTPALSFALGTQSANTVFSGPTNGAAAAPTFRALVAADIPDLTSIYQPLDADLTAIAALGTTAYGRGFLTQADASAARTYIGAGTGSGSVTSINLTAPAAGVTVAGGPITTSGSITLALADDLAALEALSGTGFARRIGTSSWNVFEPTSGGRLLEPAYFVFAGDSLASPSFTQTFVPGASGGGLSWPERVMLLEQFSGRGTGEYVAVAGDGIDELAARYVTYVLPFVPDASHPFSFLFIQIGANNLATGDHPLSTSDFNSKWAAYMGTAGGDGFTRIAFTITPRIDLNFAQNQERLTRNAYIRSRTDLWEFLVETDLLHKDVTDTVYYYDGLHQSVLGMQQTAYAVNSALSIGPLSSDGNFIGSSGVRGIFTIPYYSATGTLMTGGITATSSGTEMTITNTDASSYAFLRTTNDVSSYWFGATGSSTGFGDGFIIYKESGGNILMTGTASTVKLGDSWLTVTASGLNDTPVGAAIPRDGSFTVVNSADINVSGTIGIRFTSSAGGRVGADATNWFATIPDSAGSYLFLNAANSSTWLSITASGLTTEAPSGGAAQAWKLGNRVAGLAVQGGTVRVEINGVAVDLLTT